ncbi:L-histidine N(alpha)-methyltransferase [Methylobacterium organophilum]|uniref:L-histidine N(alpha)-methyltransferase n=1 Tax=Methylobacterium organophilum TaxID=410 RepID=UPI001F12C273|nr:L-histidine N(alpha)-methyltransferase [Methylobacterium organophilum]UMY17808.1 L-histidine N(alpha)-methyltransferase [Methylobacterium organophilum]
MAEPAIGVAGAFLRDALDGLSRDSKTLPGKYLWDDTGSDLFDRICAHPDYYPTKREMTLLPGVAAEVGAIIGAGASVIEFGAGASRKIRTLLDALEAPEAYVAIDIAGDYLEAAIAHLAPDYPSVAMTPVCADYSKPIRLPAGLAGPNVLGFFPGTSIGNFTPREATAFLARARDTLARETQGRSRFLVGADPTRDPGRLRRAYGESGGLMAAIHLNLLARLNRELGADFDRDNFHHEARLAEDPFRVEAHLVARKAATYRLGGQAIAFAAGESIRTDTSHKYAPEAFQALAGSAGWTAERLWLDPEGGFSLHLLSG